MKKIIKIARQEFKMTAANKAFIIITILGPFLILLVTFLPRLLGGAGTSIPENTRVVVTCADSNIVNDLTQIFASQKLVLLVSASEEEAKTEVLNNKAAAYLSLPNDLSGAEPINYFSKTGTDIYLSETIKGILNNYIIGKKMYLAGIDPLLIQNLTRPPVINVYKLTQEGEVAKQDFSIILMTGISFIMLIYMTVLLYGQLIARSVVIEKVSKTVEIMLSSVSPRQLMFGKILGIGLAGLLQYITWIGLALILSFVLGPALGLLIPTALEPKNLFLLLMFFLTAYFLYSAAYAAIGAAAEDERHVGQLGMPLLIFLIIPMVMVSPIIMNPHNPFVLFMSFFPLTSQIVMFARVIVEQPAVWEILLSLGLAWLTILFFIQAAAKIFRIGILMTGKRFTFIEMLKWLRLK